MMDVQDLSFERHVGSLIESNTVNIILSINTDNNKIISELKENIKQILIKECSFSLQVVKISLLKMSHLISFLTRSNL